MRLADHSPDLYAQLDALRNGMRQGKLDKQLAARALDTTRTRHTVGTQQARQRHARRPRVELV